MAFFSLDITQFSHPNKGFKPLVQPRIVSQVRNACSFNNLGIKAKHPQAG
jgi:hypothetical protein